MEALGTIILYHCGALLTFCIGDHKRLAWNKIKSSLYLWYYGEACNEWRGPSPRLSARATQLRRNVTAVASRWRHCADLTENRTQNFAQYKIEIVTREYVTMIQLHCHQVIALFLQTVRVYTNRENQF